MEMPTPCLNCGEPRELNDLRMCPDCGSYDQLRCPECQREHMREDHPDQQDGDDRG